MAFQTAMDGSQGHGYGNGPGGGRGGARPGSGNPAWQPGISGNPNGSKVGSRHLTARRLDQLAEGESDAVFRVVVDAAKGGDLLAAKILMDRIWPIRRGHTVRLDLPDVTEPGGIMAALSAIVAKMSAAEISAEEAQAATLSIVALARTLEMHPPPPDRSSRVHLYLPDNGRSVLDPDMEARRQEMLAAVEAMNAGQRPEASATPEPRANGEAVEPLEDGEDLAAAVAPEDLDDPPGVTIEGVAEPAKELAKELATLAETVAPVPPPVSRSSRPRPSEQDFARWRALAS